MNVLLFVPTYNCENQIVRVLARVKRAIPEEWTICLIDNCSQDQTIAVARSFLFAEFADFSYLILRNPRNLSLGGSHKVAFKYALENGFDWIVVLHGDDQANIDDLFISSVADQMKSEQIDCYLGSRFSNESSVRGYSKFREIGNKLLMLAYPRLNNKRISDMGSGLNVYRLEFLKDLDWSNLPDDLTFNNFFLVECIEKNAKVKFFPISWREEDQVSNAKPIRQSIKILAGIFRYRMGKKRILGYSVSSLPKPEFIGGSQQK